MSSLYIGLMSGTSLDGVDGVLVDLGAADADRLALRVVAHEHRPFDAALRSELLTLNGRCDDELARGARAANALARLYAQVVAALLVAGGVERGAVRAVAAPPASGGTDFVRGQAKRSDAQNWGNHWSLTAASTQASCYGDEASA